MTQPIRSWQDAERTALRWMRAHGFDDASVTAPGADEGVDVTSEEAVAQVKAHVVKVGRPEIQQLFGVASAGGKQALFFSLAGYTTGARSWADRAGVALFVFNLASEVEAVNESAQGVAQRFNEEQLAHAETQRIEIKEQAARAETQHIEREVRTGIESAIADLGVLDRSVLATPLREHLPRLLSPGERVVAVAQTSGAQAAIVVTSERLLLIPLTWRGTLRTDSRIRAWARAKIHAPGRAGLWGSQELHFMYEGEQVTFTFLSSKSVRRIKNALDH